MSKKVIVYCNSKFNKLSGPAGSDQRQLSGTENAVVIRSFYGEFYKVEELQNHHRQEFYGNLSEFWNKIQAQNKNLHIFASMFCSRLNTRREF